jgi:hypothetical protein
MDLSLGLSIGQSARGLLNFARLAPGTIIHAVQSDIGVTVVGGIVTAVQDQGPNGWNCASNAPTNRPLIATGSSGKPIIIFDGVDDCLYSPLTLPNPAVTSYYLYAIFQPFTVASQANYFAVGSAGVLFSGTGNVNAIMQFNGAAGNTGVMSSAMTRVYASYTGTTADVLKVGNNTATTGVSAGTNAGFEGYIGAGTLAGVFPSRMNFGLRIYATGALSPAQLAALDAAAVGYW